MAKQLSIIKAGGQAAFADTGLKLSKMILLTDIEFHSEFQKLFTIDENLLDRIQNSMVDKGFDNSQPIHIWKVTDNEITHNYLIDGYTRFAAAKKAGLKSVPYFEHKFESFEDAYKYVLSLQVNRRNLEGTELLKNISILMGTEFIQNAEGKKAEAIAEVLDVSPRTVTKALAVEKDEEAKSKVESGEMTINQAYNDMQEKKKSKKQKNEEDEDISESLDDNSGNPAGLNFNHSDGIERPVSKPSDEKEIDQWIKEKNIQVEQARIEGYGEGFNKALYFVLGEILKGRTPQEIYNDERLSDLSPSVICNFVLPEDDEDLVMNM